MRERTSVTGQGGDGQLRKGVPIHVGIKSFGIGGEGVAKEGGQGGERPEIIRRPSTSWLGEGIRFSGT